MEQIIRVLHLWSTNTPLGKMMVEVEVSLQYGLSAFKTSASHRSLLIQQLTGIILYEMSVSSTSLTTLP